MSLPHRIRILKILIHRTPYSASNFARLCLQLSSGALSAERPPEAKIVDIVIQPTAFMPFTIRSLDGTDHPFGTNESETYWRDFAAKLNSIETKTINRISRKGLINISKWLTLLNNAPWEVGVAQDFDTKNLRLIKGSEGKSFDVAASISARALKEHERVIVHVHPVFRTKRDHLNLDRKNAFEFIEGVLDWSNCLTCYDRTAIYNPYISGAGGQLMSAEDMYRQGKIPFLEGDDIVGYSQFDKETKRPTFRNPFLTKDA